MPWLFLNRPGLRYFSKAKIVPHLITYQPTLRLPSCVAARRHASRGRSPQGLSDFLDQIRHINAYRRQYTGWKHRRPLNRCAVALLRCNHHSSTMPALCACSPEHLYYSPQNSPLRNFVCSPESFFLVCMHQLHSPPHFDDCVHPGTLSTDSEWKQGRE